MIRDQSKNSKNYKRPMIYWKIWKKKPRKKKRRLHMRHIKGSVDNRHRGWKLISKINFIKVKKQSKILKSGNGPNFQLMTRKNMTIFWVKDTIKLIIPNSSKCHSNRLTTIFNKARMLNKDPKVLHRKNQDRTRNKSVKMNIIEILIPLNLREILK